MQKVNIKLIDRLILNKASSIDIDLLLYLARVQNDFGHVRDIYYKDVCLNLGISNQSFYNSLQNLENMNIITVDYSTWGTYSCTLCENIYINKNSYKENSYINTNRFNFLYSQDFKNACVNIKYLVLNLLKSMREDQYFRISDAKLRKYAGVESSCIYVYVDYIARWFNFKLKKDVYSISLKNELKSDNNSEYINYIKHRLETYCRAYKVNYTIKDMKDVLILFKQYKNRLKSLIKAITDTCYQYKSLQPKLINFAVNHNFNI